MSNANIIEGTPDNDTLTGTSEAEIIRGLEGNDVLRGQEGDDTLEGGLGSDRLNGGDGADTFVVLSGEGRDTINDFVRGEDLLSSDLDFAEINTFVSNGNINIVDSNTNNIFAQLRNTTEFTSDDYVINNPEPNIIEGTPNDDTLIGTIHAETIRGLEGNDALRGQEGDDTLEGGLGSDRITGGDGADTFVVLSGEGRDTINDFVRGEDLFSSNINFADLNIDLRNGNINISDRKRNIIAVLKNTTEFTQSDYILNENPLDIDDPLLIEGTANNDTLTGRHNDDTIRGLEGNDVLRGKQGDDILEGGLGSDRLNGGDGADTFVVLSGEGKDIINDFVRGEDLFSSDVDFAELNTFVSNGDLNIVDSNTNAIIAVLRNTTEFTFDDYIIAGDTVPVA